MAMKEAEGQEADVFRFENVGDRLEGTLIEIKPSDKYGHVFGIENAAGKYVVVGMDLDSKMKCLPIGCSVEIELKAKQKTKKGVMKLYKVMYDDGSVAEEEVREQLKG